jgi:hypothetical protein
LDGYGVRSGYFLSFAVLEVVVFLQVRQLTEDIALILDALQDSSLVEVKVSLENISQHSAVIALFVLTVWS